VAGLGSRFLPVTKASPKEMLPIVDKPLIQFAVEEAAAAGITDMIFITGRNKRAIEDHFDKAYELETELAARKKTDLLGMIQGVLPRGINCIYIRQAEALGLGHAVLCAEPVIGNEPFAVLLADEKVLAYQFEGRRYDCGNKLGYLEAMVDYGVKHPEVGEAFARFLAERVA
jgi:UTP--glucose-1-phosphate uridylyltransferase